MSEKPFRPVWIIGFAGHRQLEDATAIKAAILVALQEFRTGVEGECVGRSSAASGSDLLFLQACRELGMPISVVLPFPQERFREDFDDDEAQRKIAEDFVASAASVEIAPGHEVAPEAYHLAAREILDTADLMIFVWDGQPPRGIGGTAESVAEARERHTPLRIIDAGTANLRPMEGSKPLPWRDVAFEDVPSANTVDELFEKLDQRSGGAAPRARWFAAGSISLNQLATVTSAILIAFKLGENAAPAVKFLIVVIAAALPWVGARFRINDAWRDDRRRAELLRSLLASHSFAPPLRPFAADLFDEDARLLRSAAWHLIPERQEWSLARDHYLVDRLEAQHDYFTRQGHLAAKRLRALGIAFRIASIGALVLGAIAIWAGLSKYPVSEGTNRLWLTFLPTILPAVAAWCLAMIPLFEHQRRAKIYLRMADQLAARRIELIEAKCRTTAAAVAASCERLLLTELWEWTASRGKRKG